MGRSSKNKPAASKAKTNGAKVAKKTTSTKKSSPAYLSEETKLSDESSEEGEIIEEVGEDSDSEEFDPQWIIHGEDDRAFLAQLPISEKTVSYYYEHVKSSAYMYIF